MRQGWQESLLNRSLLLLTLLLAWHLNPVVAQLSAGPGEKKFGDRCDNDQECGFNGSFCDFGKCGCRPEFPVTNHLDKCGLPAKVNESCFFNEQCENVTPETVCRDNLCHCRFEKEPAVDSQGNIQCVIISNRVYPGRYIDPAMIGILVAMFLMFITICVVLRLFSKARWRENRTIFNTPNPRLMNVSLLKDNKQLHGDRRGSKASVKGPSRQPSMASLRGATSPNSHQGSLRGSKASTNASASSLKSNNKSPSHHPNLNSATTPMYESVTVEVQEAKA